MPSRKTLWMGMPPATLASIARLMPAPIARSQISAPHNAINSLLAVTTDLPCSIAASMISGLTEVDPVSRYSIDEAVLLGDSPGPSAGEFMLERFWLADAMKWVSEGIFHELQDAESDVAIRFHPPAEILTKFRVECSVSRSRLAQARGPAVVCQSPAPCLAGARRSEERAAI